MKVKKVEIGDLVRKINVPELGIICHARADPQFTYLVANEYYVIFWLGSGRFGSYYSPSSEFLARVREEFLKYEGI
jgi:hypothetical protein